MRGRGALALLGMVITAAAGAPAALAANETPFFKGVCKPRLGYSYLFQTVPGMAVHAAIPLACTGTHRGQTVFAKPMDGHIAAAPALIVCRGTSAGHAGVLLTSPGQGGAGKLTDQALLQFDNTKRRLLVRGIRLLASGVPGTVTAAFTFPVATQPACKASTWLTTLALTGSITFG